MERIYHRESILLGYSPQRSLTTHYSSSPNSQGRDSDIDFNDVFGGPPRRSSVQEARNSFGETADFYALTSEDEHVSFRNRLSGLNERPVFGDEGMNRRRYTNNDFFYDIFKGGESLSSSPRKHDRDLFSSSPGSRVLSPVRPLPPKAEPFGSSLLPAQFSLPVRLMKETDLPTFGSSTHNHHKNKDGVPHGTSYCSPLSRLSSAVNHFQEKLGNDVHYDETSSPQDLSLGSSNETNTDEIYKGSKLKKDSNNSQNPSNNRKFHFSICKWASKGVPLAMPLRGGNSSRLKENSNLERCSGSNRSTECEGVVRELPTTTLCDTDFHSSNANASLDTDTSDILKQWEAILGNSEMETPTCQVILEDVPGNKVFQNSEEEIKPSCIPDMVIKEAPRTEQKPLHSLFFDNDYDQDANETIRKNIPKESKVKSTKKSSAVFDVSENGKEQDIKGTILRSGKEDKSRKPGDNIGNSRVKGKVKEFVKIFNQEASIKPASNVDHQTRSGKKGGGKFRPVDEASVTTTKINEKNNLPTVNKKNIPEAPVKGGECLGKSKKQHPETRTTNYNSRHISSGLKDSSASIAASIPEGLEPSVGDGDESFNGNFLVKELVQDEDTLPQNGNNDEKIQLQVIDAKIRRWLTGKEGNIRALLSTLQYVLWPESGWKPVPLADIIEGNAVKRSYQKALICLHPDKLQQKGATSHQKYIAEKVFGILQEAWTHFNSLGAM